MPPTIVLMGLRGSGKTTVGQMLAARLGREFVDLDDLTPGVLGEGAPAAALSRHGEAAFRRAETEALRGVLGRAGVVLALGGGTPTAPGAADLLRELVSAGAPLAYLHAEPATLRARLQGTDASSRPSLTGRGTLDEIEDVYRARDGLYRGLCTVLVETGSNSEEEIVERLRGLCG